MQSGKAVYVGGYDSSDGYQVVDAALFEKLGQLGVENVWLNAALQYIAKDERALTTFFFGATVHEV